MTDDSGERALFARENPDTYAPVWNVGVQASCC
jgi:hypothetical protein